MEEALKIEIFKNNMINSKWLYSLIKYKVNKYSLLCLSVEKNFKQFFLWLIESDNTIDLRELLKLIIVFDDDSYIKIILDKIYFELSYADYESIYILSCKMGSSQICIYLTLLLSEISTQYNNIADRILSAGFKAACEIGHLDIIEYLYSCNINKKHCDVGFTIACIKNNINAAKLLCNLCNKYKIYIKNNMIIKYVIRSDIEVALEIGDYNYIINYLNIYELDSDVAHDIFNCSICYDTYDITIRTNCKHYFCPRCIFKWFLIQKNDTCPSCRTRLIIYKFYYKYKQTNKNESENENENISINSELDKIENNKNNREDETQFIIEEDEFNSFI